MTNPDTDCGFGYRDMCCCMCSYLAFAKPRCHHLGGGGECKPPPTFPEGPLGDLAKEGYLLEESERPKSYVCTGLLHTEGIVLTDWQLHGACELYDRAEVPLDPDVMAALLPQERPF